jgi:low molecular weight protein-tyrosine phosphatase
MNILFVCTGNICRSPIAEAFLKKKFSENNIEGIVESAGFSPTTINEPPDDRAILAAKKYNLELKGRSRLFEKRDFKNFDYIFCMDTLNYDEVIDLAKTKSNTEKVDYLMNIIEPGSNKIVPDPIHSGTVDIKDIIGLLDKITDKLVEKFK